ncbi:hypothetical protein BgAZ_400340 [Babesia gibsoni]|uniref:Lon N-terminal domain-containing protein n=1 Tax=Babesia gibsoni TaxID=33632 RepID=A0AAD8LGZ1_BABGI|nr:hypothetical protein BgAZ_400340 [Babesia gibsoni]
MGVCSVITLIAFVLAGIPHTGSLSSSYRNDSTRSLTQTKHGHMAFVTPFRRTHGLSTRRKGHGVANGGLVRFAEDSDEQTAVPDTTDAENRDLVPELGRVHVDKEDNVTIHEQLERKSIEYIDNSMLEGDQVDTSHKENGSEEAKDSNYFNWDRIRDNRNQTSEEVIKSVDSTGSRELERGQRPIVTGHGTDMEIHIEDYPTNVDTGRLNEWNPAWVPGEKVMSFFPILVDEYSLMPSPLQLGFEEPVTFRGKYVDMTFNSLLETMEFPGGASKQIFGMCFINPTSGQLAPLAVYAELLSREAFVDGGGERLKVEGRVLGRVILSQVVMEEPFIKAKIIPMEDNPNFTQAEEVPKLVDEITSLYESCNKVECEMMELLEQPYAVARVKERVNLHDLIDQRLDKFNVDLEKGPQAFAQIAAYTAFDYHLTADERYDALVMQDSFDRLRYVRDCLRKKLKQLNILKKAPREKLEDIVEQMKQMQLNKEDTIREKLEEAEKSEEQ